MSPRRFGVIWRPPTTPILGGLQEVAVRRPGPRFSTIVEKVAEAIGLPKAEASRAMETLVQTIVDAAKAGEEVRVTGLGIFDVVTREARPGRNPQTGS
jgi:hypothetical protein